METLPFALDLTVQYAVDADSLPRQEQLQIWVEAALKGADVAKKPLSLTVRIISSQESQELNHQFRDKEQPTNVLSFPFELPAELPPEAIEDMLAEEMILGDLAICAEVVEREAAEQKKTLHDHWAHMVVHGCLHLLGYDHIKDQDAEVMEALEVNILSKLKISDPYHIDN